jgi:hypothetical protein
MNKTRELHDMGQSLWFVSRGDKVAEKRPG